MAQKGKSFDKTLSKSNDSIKEWDHLNSLMNLLVSYYSYFCIQQKKVLPSDFTLCWFYFKAD